MRFKKQNILTAISGPCGAPGLWPVKPVACKACVLIRAYWRHF